MPTLRGRLHVTNLGARALAGPSLVVWVLIAGILSLQAVARGPDWGLTMAAPTGII